MRRIFKMKVAIFSGMTCHFECLGAYIYYCKSNNLDYTLFALSKHRHGWVNFYIKHLDPNMKVRYPKMEEKEFEEFDKVILVNDEDRFLHHRFNTSNKLIVIDHGTWTHRPETVNAIHLGTKPSNINIGRKYVYSIIPWMTKERKKEILKKVQGINICIIGGNNKNPELLKLLNVNWPEIHLFVIARYIDKNIHEFYKTITPNYFPYENCSTETMFDIVSKCHFALFLYEDKVFFNECMTGTLNMSFSNFCQPVIPREYNSVFKFKSPLYIEDKPNLMTSYNIDIVAEDRDAIIANNQESLSTCLK